MTERQFIIFLRAVLKDIGHTAFNTSINTRDRLDVIGVRAGNVVKEIDAFLAEPEREEVEKLRQLVDEPHPNFGVVIPDFTDDDSE